MTLRLSHRIGLMAPIAVAGILLIVGIFSVEQRVAEALEPCDRAYVLEAGRTVLEGPPAVVMKDERIRRAYLGHH